MVGSFAVGMRVLWGLKVLRLTVGFASSVRVEVSLQMEKERGVL